MKKILFFVVLILMSYSTFAKDTTKSVIPDTAKITMTTVYKDIKGAIVAIADGLKVGTEKVFIILVKQQVVKSIVDVTILLFFIFILFLFVSYFVRNDKRRYKEDDPWYNDNISDHSNLVISIIGSIIFLIISISVFACNIDTIVTGFVNPEYGAIQTVFDFMNPQTNCR